MTSHHSYEESTNNKTSANSYSSLFTPYMSPVSAKNVIITNTPEECTEALQALKVLCTDHCILGFDCEWVTSYAGRRPVSLVQLATVEGYCILMRIRCSRDFPSALKELLEDPSILKVGYDPFDDAGYLLYDYLVETAACVDLQDLTLLTGGTPKGGLKGLAKQYLDVTMDKREELTRSDWNVWELSEEQINYAADDALVCVQIFEKLRHLCPPIMTFFEDYAPCTTIKTEDLVGMKCIVGPLIPKKKKKNKKPTMTARAKAMCISALSFYKMPLLFLPNGNFFCVHEGASLLLDDCKAEKVSETPFVVKLLCNPLQCCAVCGEEDMKYGYWKNIVPIKYRIRYPEKSRGSVSDVFTFRHLPEKRAWLCVQCLAHSMLLENDFMKFLAQKCNASLSTEIDFLQDRERSCKLMEKNLTSKQFEDVYEEFKHFLYDSDTYRDSLKNHYVPIPRLNDNTHYAKVVQFYMKKQNGGIEKLEADWFSVFMTMDPRFLFVFTVMKEAKNISYKRKKNRQRKKHTGPLPAEDITEAFSSSLQICDDK